MRSVAIAIVMSSVAIASADEPDDSDPPPGYPLEDIKRPQVIPKRMLELTPRLAIEYVSDTGPTGVEASQTVTSLGIAGRYGIADKLELLGAFDRLVLSPTPKDATGEDANGDRLKGVLTGGAGYAITSGKLDLEAKGVLAYDARDEILVFAAGVDVRYKLSSALWLGTPVNEPGLVVTLRGADAGLTEIRPTFFTIPIGLGYQPLPLLMLQVQTKLARLNLNEDAQLIAAAEAGSADKKSVSIGGADLVSLGVDGIYAVNRTLDLRVAIDFESTDLRDRFAFVAGINLRR
ncbi:MAG: hypothetical protein ABI867_08465 [Kofleriaceae bacterium]